MPKKKPKTLINPVRNSDENNQSDKSSNELNLSHKNNTQLAVIEEDAYAPLITQTLAQLRLKPNFYTASRLNALHKHVILLTTEIVNKGNVNQR